MDHGGHAQARPSIISDLPGAWQALHLRPAGHRNPGASGAVNRWLRPDSVRHMSVTTATQRLTAAHHETRRDKTQKAREAGKIQLTGYFRRWWQVLGSNQRRLSRRFYIPEGAGRGQGAVVPVFVAFPGRFWHAGRRAGVQVERPAGRTTWRPALLPAHTGPGRERAIGGVWVSAPRVQFVSWAGSRLRSSLRGCPRLVAAGAWGGARAGSGINQTGGRATGGGGQ
jgi:hypothetical protein